jgi:D-alanyl-lipoteichoic acid acyltransferase DltB (MBOAT superfamily)
VDSNKKATYLKNFSCINNDNIESPFAVNDQFYHEYWDEWNIVLSKKIPVVH